MRPYDPVEADRQVQEARQQPDPLKWRRRRGYVVIAVIIASIISIIGSACGGWWEE